MKKFLSVLGASLFALGFVGCSNELENSNDFSALLLAKSNAVSSSLTGSFTYEFQSSRSINVSDIKAAKVELAGYDSTGAKFSKSSDVVAVSNGKPASSISIKEVPVADNVVVTVRSYSDAEGSIHIPGEVIRTVVKISSGSNSVSADWDSSRKGNIYNALVEGGVNTNTGVSAYVSSINTLVSNLKSAGVHANLIDVEKILSVVKNGGTLSTSASDYVISTGTVNAKVYGYYGKTIRIADPVSEAQTAGDNGSVLTFSTVLPGKWKVYADDEYVKSIPVSAGNNDVTIGNALAGKTVIFVKANYSNVYVWTSSSKAKLNGEWPGREWTSSDCSSYMNDATGWKMLDLTNVYTQTSETINFIVTDASGGKEYGDRDFESGKSATFWFDGTNYYDSDPTESQLSSDATLASISVNGTAISGFAAGTLSYNTSIAAGTTSASVTAVANDSAASVSVSPSGSASIAAGAVQAFTITVTAEDGTVAIYTVNVKRAEENDTTLTAIAVNGKAASISGTNATYSTRGSEDSLSISSITATAADSNAKITYSATTDTVADGASKTFSITVKNGSKSATYTLTVSYTKKDPASGQYGTNDKGYGVNKTISSWSDWTEAMQIARGAAYDDPRTWKGHQETAYDAYALYAAYDDTNLYLMVELTNLPDGRATFMNHDYAGSDNAWWDNRDCPLGFIINTGKGAVSTSPTVSKNGSTGPIWDAINFTDSEGFDFLFYASSKYGYADHKSAFVGVGEPGFFKLNKSTGYFSYDSDYCLSANSGAPGSEVAGTSGISVRYIRKCQVSNKVKFESSPKDNRTTSGQTGEDLMASETYTEVETNDLDMSYWYTIPLATLGVDKAYIESNGIGVRQLTPNGGSIMDCLPWDPCMVDVAAESCSDDESTSKEKQDVDNITSAQARVGR